MINWFIIIVVVLVIFVLFKISHLKHSRHKFTLIAIILILAFFLTSLYFVTKANNIDITTLSGLSNGMQVYAGWLLNSFSNIKALTGYAIGMDWSPLNKSISSNKTISDNTKTQDVKQTTVNNIAKAADKVKANTPRLITSYK